MSSLTPVTTRPSYLLFSRLSEKNTALYNRDAYRFLSSVRTFATGASNSPSPSPLHVSNLRDNPGATKKRKRVGRGLGGGKGKTSGRGQKGWLARSAKSRPIPGFEGGQTGLLKAIPKLGVRKGIKKRFQRLYLDTLQHWIDTKRIDPSKTITIKVLRDSGCIGKDVKDGVVVLARVGN